MQACKAYYSNGRFVPLDIGKLPEGARAIVTLLDEIPKDTIEKLKEFETIMQAIEAAAGEEMPPIESIRFRRAEI